MRTPKESAVLPARLTHRGRVTDCNRTETILFCNKLHLISSLLVTKIAAPPVESQVLAERTTSPLLDRDVFEAFEEGLLSSSVCRTG